MAIVAGDLILYSAASRPEDDTSTGGGAIDTASRPELTQFTANAEMVFKSDGADTRTGAIKHRLPSGVIATHNFTLNGTTEVLSGVTAERVLEWHMNTTSGTRTVSLLQGTGGTVRATIGINETTRHILFMDSTSEAGISTRFDKGFLRNNHGTLALTTAAVTLTADPSARYKVGLATAKGDTATIANRKAVPSGPTFVDDSVAQNVPTGNLGATEVIGCWVEQTLPAVDPPTKTTMTLQLAGSST